MKKFPFEKVIDWYKKNNRSDLPWREYNFNKKTLGYRVWLSEIILQQTQVSRGIEYFDKIIKAFPTIEELASTSYDDFFDYYSGLGYYSRARNMLKTAILVSEEFGGIFPEKTSELMTLPGIGPYTAEAIRAFAYKKSTLSFDTNLHKVFSRYYYGNKFQKLSKLETTTIQKQFESTGFSGRDINNALMDFATEFNIIEFPKNGLYHAGVTNKKERESLPLNVSPFYKQSIIKYPLINCKYFITQGELEPKKIKKKSIFPEKQACIFIILHKNHKTYFSTDLDTYKPFILGKSNINSRDFAKQYFLNKFDLHISVRPPHKKDIIDGKPFLVCYAQIQKGEHNFGEYIGIDKEKISIDILNIR